jgi:hypothetical protein
MIENAARLGNALAPASTDGGIVGPPCNRNATVDREAKKIEQGFFVERIQ